MRNRYFKSAGALLLIAAAPLPAQAQAANPASATIESCLSLVQSNQTARGPHDPDELTEKPGPEGRLNAARDAAPMQQESCIGVAATACIQAGGNMSDSVLNQCYDREGDAWDARLNAAYKQLLASADDKATADGFRKTQRAWIAFRDASCGQAVLVFKGTMAGPMAAYCRLDMTARQALWLEGWPH